MRKQFMHNYVAAVGLMLLLAQPIAAQAEGLVVRFADAAGAPIRKASATLPEKIRLDPSVC